MKSSKPISIFGRSALAFLSPTNFYYQTDIPHTYQNVFLRWPDETGDHKDNPSTAFMLDMKFQAKNLRWSGTQLIATIETESKEVGLPRYGVHDPDDDSGVYYLKTSYSYSGGHGSFNDRVATETIDPLTGGVTSTSTSARDDSTVNVSYSEPNTDELIQTNAEAKLEELDWGENFGYSTTPGLALRLVVENGPCYLRQSHFKLNADRQYETKAGDRQWTFRWRLYDVPTTDDNATLDWDSVTFRGEDHQEVDGDIGDVHLELNDWVDVDVPDDFGAVQITGPAWDYDTDDVFCYGIASALNVGYYQSPVGMTPFGDFNQRGGFTAFDTSGDSPIDMYRVATITSDAVSIMMEWLNDDRRYQVHGDGSLIKWLLVYGPSRNDFHGTTGSGVTGSIARAGGLFGFNTDWAVMGWKLNYFIRTGQIKITSPTTAEGMGFTFTLSDSVTVSSQESDLESAIGDMDPYIGGHSLSNINFSNGLWPTKGIMISNFFGGTQSVYLEKQKSKWRIDGFPQFFPYDYYSAKSATWADSPPDGHYKVTIRDYVADGSYTERNVEINFGDEGTDQEEDFPTEKGSYSVIHKIEAVTDAPTSQPIICTPVST